LTFLLTLEDPRRFRQKPRRRRLSGTAAGTQELGAD
jgi:hypothetical protein